ncbi:MAG: type I restriction endonuclease subunit R [Proteobacteria bacterium]|nr:type I restriction endonuclease subunit R [Pseudomonadota bacterium]MBU4470203.1 type I restriction endonuclease subunit R [Pseudomonadota bacterium]MCG2752619.1 type I restriction endonuclease subunit R [Desulfobacteraceae bacterium]
MSNRLYESEIEQISLDILRDENGYITAFGPDISEGDIKEREYTEVVLQGRLKTAIDRLNPAIPVEAREAGLKKALRTLSVDLLENNEAFHQMVTDGIDVKFSVGDGKARTDKVWLVDFAVPENNEFLAVNQYTVLEDNNRKRPDVVVMVNGLPMVVMELKNAADENADVHAAYQQLQTYKQLIPSLFVYNAILIVSDGWFARVGTISSEYPRFMEWKTGDGETIVDTRQESALEPMLIGLLNKKTLLDLIRHFIVFEKTREKTIKKVAAYHQFYAVNKAIESTIRAALPPEGEGAENFSPLPEVREDPVKFGLANAKDQPPGDKRAGVVWHTQGSGKSLTMVFFAGKLVLADAMNNPTLVVLTDRNDLDQQLFETFSNCRLLLRQAPAQAASREELKKMLAVSSGGVVFTTIQKFFPDEVGAKYPLLSERLNIVVIADEAHRSQYDFVDGFARHMRDALPNATFIGFTGTPIEKEDKNTQAVFGDYIDVYDIQQAVEDGATVRIYYESRLARIELSPEDQKILDEQVEEVTEGDELTERQKRFARWTGKEAVVGSAARLEQVASDLVHHFEQRLAAADGKGMIVCMSRRICVDLHDRIIQLRPHWYDADDSKGTIKVIMTGSASDPLNWQEHIRNKSRRKAIGDRLKDPKDPLRLVIVRDMWLTGFDAPCLHTLYIDKPMSGHNLMQAIARVNRVFGDKDGGLIVDYIGIAQDLKNAMAVYTERGKGKLAYDQEDAVARMLEFYEIVVDMFGSFDYRRYFTLEPKAKLNFILDTANYISELTEEQNGKKVRNGQERFRENVVKLQKAFGLAVPHPAAWAIRDHLAFFQAIKARFAKFDQQSRKRTDEEIETAIRQIINDAIISQEVIDVFDAAGIRKPDISILSDEFLAEVQGMARKNLALELLKRLLSDEIRSRTKTNLVQGRKFSEMLAEAVKRYQNGLIDSARIIEELIHLAKEIREADKRGEKLNLRVDELAFYDALADNPSAESVLGDQVLKQIAHELVENVRKNTSIDWQLKASVQAKLRVLVKRILRKYKYPPDDPETGEYTVSVNKVLDQAELLADFWTQG